MKSSAFVFFCMLFLSGNATAQEINIYSYRQPILIEHILDAFTKETGIKTNVVYIKKGLVERLKAEGRNSPADVVLANGISQLLMLDSAKLLRKLNNADVKKQVPANLRSDNWASLTFRARVIYASKDRVNPADISSYMDLADSRWKGKICTRPGDHNYNIALIASMIKHHGKAATKKWLRDVKKNLARKPQGNDRAQVKAIKEGICDLAIGNNYYYGKMIADDKQRAWALSSHVIFPKKGSSAEQTGTHINVSGIGIARNAPHPKAAQQFVSFLVGEKAQGLYSAVNFEYPVRRDAKWSPLMLSLGRFDMDPVSIEEVGKLRKTALQLVNEVGFNE